MRGADQDRRVQRTEDRNQHEALRPASRRSAPNSAVAVAARRSSTLAQFGERQRVEIDRVDHEVDRRARAPRPDEEGARHVALRIADLARDVDRRVPAEVARTAPATARAPNAADARGFAGAAQERRQVRDVTAAGATGAITPNASSAIDLHVARSALFAQRAVAARRRVQPRAQQRGDPTRTAARPAAASRRLRRARSAKPTASVATVPAKITKKVSQPTRKPASGWNALAQVDVVAARVREHRAELGVRERACEREQAADDPRREDQARDGAGDPRSSPGVRKMPEPTTDATTRKAASWSESSRRSLSRGSRSDVARILACARAAC